MGTKRSYLLRLLLTAPLIAGLFTATSNSFAQTDDELGQVNAVAGENLSVDKQLEDVFSGRTNPSLDQLRLIQDHTAQLVKKLRPATVGVQVNQAQGSGVIVSRKGYVLTAAHVIGGPNRRATIRLPDGRQLNAKTLGINSRFDSGMLQITSDSEFPYLPIGESGDLRKGQWVVALGRLP